MVIPHGLNERFFSAPREQRILSDCSPSTPFRLIYVSIIDQYKHQRNVIRAVARLRESGFPLVLDLVGPANPVALAKLRVSMEEFDANSEWVFYHGAVPYDRLHLLYRNADLGVFASSCENLPIILLETMAAGLPIACSNRGPMPEVLGNAGVYFDPEKPEEIAAALRYLLDSPTVRLEKYNLAYHRAQEYSWVQCASWTFEFLARVANDRI